MAGTETLNKKVVPHTEKPHGALGGGLDGLNKKIKNIKRILQKKIYVEAFQDQDRVCSH